MIEAVKRYYRKGFDPTALSPANLKIWKGFSWWMRVKYRHPLPFITYYALRNLITRTQCKGHNCEWVYPYGFVPEAGCPIHD